MLAGLAATCSLPERSSKPEPAVGVTSGSPQDVDAVIAQWSGVIYDNCSDTVAAGGFRPDGGGR
jgi:hypothetical protein